LSYTNKYQYLNNINKSSNQTSLISIDVNTSMKK